MINIISIRRIIDNTNNIHINYDTQTIAYTDFITINIHIPISLYYIDEAGEVSLRRMISILEGNYNE